MVSGMASPVAERAPAGAIDLLDGDLYAGDPDPTYAWLRQNAPVYRDETNHLWGISRYQDVVAIEKDPATFCSSEGYRPNIPADDSMIGNDDPRHNERRRLVARRFTPRPSPGTRMPCGRWYDSSSTPSPTTGGARSSRSWRRRCRPWLSRGSSASTTNNGRA